jgi:hypothetical protein
VRTTALWALADRGPTASGALAPRMVFKDSEVDECNPYPVAWQLVGGEAAIRRGSGDRFHEPSANRVTVHG